MNIYSIYTNVMIYNNNKQETWFTDKTHCDQYFQYKMEMQSRSLHELYFHSEPHYNLRNG